MSEHASPNSPTLLDLADIQGGILRTYGNGFPKGRCIFFHVRDAVKGRAFVEAMRPLITTAARWKDPERGEPLIRSRVPRVKDVVRAQGVPDYPGRVQLMKPKVTANIAFTYPGLKALGVPDSTLHGLPTEFIEGMEARAAMLGDDPFLDKRDPVWKNSRGDGRVHILVTLYAAMNEDGTPCAELDRMTETIERFCENSDGGVIWLEGASATNPRWQEMSSVMVEVDGKPKPSRKEHFGLADGYGDPVFSGQFSGEAERVRVAGGGKILKDYEWAPIATGEFLLGYADEAQEVPNAGLPHSFSRNGTFMAYRKLHEDVAAFDSHVASEAKSYSAEFGVGLDEAEATIKAKMVGRWYDGIPLMAAPTYKDWLAFRAELEKAQREGDKPKLAQLALKFTNFHYASDRSGATCPVTSHLRRANPRDSLGPSYQKDGRSKIGSALVNRRRILRRGLPYGQYDRSAPPDHGDHGIIFMAICSSLFRQFEFVQQQWMQYALDFDAGSDTCPVIGNHLEPDQSKQVITRDPDDGKPPYINAGIPQLVESRGGDYFFIPSMTSLRMIASGIIDPT